MYDKKTIQQTVENSNNNDNNSKRRTIMLRDDLKRIVEFLGGVVNEERGTVFFENNIPRQPFEIESFNPYSTAVIYPCIVTIAKVEDIDVNAIMTVVTYDTELNSEMMVNNLLKYFYDRQGFLNKLNRIKQRFADINVESDNN